jgi:hypothetical protein
MPNNLCQFAFYFQDWDDCSVVPFQFTFVVCLLWSVFSFPVIFYQSEFILSV